MKTRFLILVTLATALLAVPTHSSGQAPPMPPGPHAMPGPAGQPDMMAQMMAADAKLDALVKKMNAARGAAKVDAIAEVVTAMVENHKAMCGGMMGSMMQAPPAAPK